MSESVKLALGSVVRWALTFLFAGLATHKVVDGPLLGGAINELTGQIVGVLGVLGTLGWSQVQKLWTAHRIKTALAMPPSSTEAQLDVVVKKTAPGLIPLAPVPTPAKAAAIVKADA